MVQVKDNYEKENTEHLGLCHQISERTVTESEVQSEKIECKVVAIFRAVEREFKIKGDNR